MRVKDGIILIALIILMLLGDKTGVAMGGVGEKGYKTYKNNELGFSFKYPKQWYLEETPRQLIQDNRGALLFDLINFDPNKETELPSNKLTQIDCNYFEDQIKASINAVNSTERIKSKIKKNMKIEKIEQLKIKRGIVLLAAGYPYNEGIKGHKYEVAYLYLAGKKGRYILEFFPHNLADRGEYLRFLKSIEMFR